MGKSNMEDDIEFEKPLNGHGYDKEDLFGVYSNSDEDDEGFYDDYSNDYDDYNSDYDDYNDNYNNSNEPAENPPETKDIEYGVEDELTEEGYDARERAYEDYTIKSSNDALKKETNDIELYLKYNCKNGKYFTEEELIKLCEDLKSDDPTVATTARDHISMGVFKYVRYIVSQKYSQNKEEICDLIHVGMEAVLRNAGGYDTNQGALTTYFKPYILSSLQTYVNSNNYNLDKANHYGNKIQKMKRIINDKVSKGVNVVIEDLAISEGIDKTTLERCLSIQYSTEQSVSIDDENVHAANLLEGHALGPEAVVETKERNMQLANIINSVDEQCKTAFLLHFGIIDSEKRSLIEVARIMGISPPTAKMLVNKAYLIYREELKKSQLFNADRRERRKKYNTKAIDYHVKSSELQRMLDDIDLENMELGDDFVS